MSVKIVCFVTLLLLNTAGLASPIIESWTERGAKVLYVHAPELPMVDISVVFNAGAARDGEQLGLARMTNAMLDEGAAGNDADQIAAAFADVGAQYTANSERDMAVLSLRSLTQTKALQQAINFFAAVLTQPDFPQPAFERLKRQLLQELEAEKQSPTALAGRQFYRRLYGDHPYANKPSGVIESVRLIQLVDLKKFYQKFYVRNNAVVAIVGDVDRNQARELAEQLLAGLESGEKSPPLAPVRPLRSSEMISLAYPSSQTTILMGQIGISRHDPDYLPLYVGNHILGGSGLVSILSDEVREKRGLTYGIYSYFRPMMMQGPYLFWLQTRNDQTEQALRIMQDTVREFVNNGPSERQLKAAKQNITGSFVLRIDSNREIASYLAMIGFYGLPLDYLETFNDKVNQVTLEDIKDAFLRRVHPDKMLTVLVGGKN